MTKVRRLLLLGLAVALAGCRTPERGGGLPVQFEDYPDVPVPAAMTRDQAHSLRFETPIVGSVVHVYRGGGLDVSALTDHFLQRMPSLGWRLVSRFELESTMLVFQKQGLLAFVGIGVDAGSPTLSVLVGSLGGPVVSPPTQKN